MGFVESFLIFLGVNAGNNFIPLKLELGALEFIFGLFHRRIVFGPRDVFLRLFLGNLPNKVFVGAFLIQIVFCLSLRIKFDQDGIFFHMGAGGNQLGDDHGADLSSFEPGGQDHEGARGLRGSIQAEYLRETLPFHSYRGLASSSSPLALPEVREKIGDGNEKQKGGSRQHDLAGLTAEKGGLVHIASTILRRNPETNTLSGMLDFRLGD